MNILYFLIPAAIFIAGIFIGMFIWAVKNGQFDDLKGPSYRIFINDESNHNSKERKDV
jgi:cbb3-type cytochrome oxidase maturation protein